jgi:signal transduction histidine kinase
VTCEHRETFAARIAARLDACRDALCRRWLERLDALRPLEVREVRPTECLVEHVPAILAAIAGNLRIATSERLSGGSGVIDNAQQLGNLRYEQDASVHQILREYDLLADVLADFVASETQAIVPQPSAGECLDVARRVDASLRMLTRTTLDTFVDRYAETIESQKGRLESFNRMVGHELRNPLNAVQLAAALLESADAPLAGQAAKVTGIIDRSVQRAKSVLDGLERTTQPTAADAAVPATQEVSVAAVARDVAGQLRDAAASRAIDVRVADDLPVLVVDVAQLEMILVNLLANAIKYSDPSKSERFVEIVAVPVASEGRCAFRVCDNGIGIPADQLPFVFERFFRAHSDADSSLGNDGSGLGLYIVRECVETLDGAIDVQSIEGEGTEVTITLPETPSASLRPLGS